MAISSPMWSWSLIATAVGKACLPMCILLPISHLILNYVYDGDYGISFSDFLLLWLGLLLCMILCFAPQMFTYSWLIVSSPHYFNNKLMQKWYYIQSINLGMEVCGLAYSILVFVYPGQNILGFGDEWMTVVLFLLVCVYNRLILFLSWPNNFDVES